MENQVRPALCCSVTIRKDGVIGDDIRFFAANIKSHARLVYDHVSDWLETGSSEQWQPSEEIAQVVRDLYAFSQARANWRETHAVVFPDRPDYRFELSADNDVVAIHADMRRTANRLVEESMITANICAGKTLQTTFGFGVFNTHAGFKAEKMADVVELMAVNGAPNADAETLATVEGFAALRRWLATQETSYLDNRIRKYQSYSEIGNQPLPHFAMGLDVYATWTSPIRKYGDMINHRLLKAHILGKARCKRRMRQLVKNWLCTVNTTKLLNVMWQIGSMRARWLMSLRKKPASKLRSLISTVRACVFAYSKMAQWPLFREL